MSQSSRAPEEPRIASREEIVEWVKKRIVELEEELRILKSLLSMIESPGRPIMGEKVEEVKAGRRRIARVYRGDSYVRMVPELPLPLPLEVREYLESVVREIRESQARAGVPEDERARLYVKERPDNSVSEVGIENLYSTIDIIKARAALKYSAELAYQVYKSAQEEDV
ncbi:MAG: hypothetical protein F7C07_02845 [Desulfurococcales archaeon]|nr:hypothetical protein [Desulfurococcales archaeon]